MTKKIVIIGPESTGKSTLTEQLARHYQTAWVPEYARAYIDGLPGEYREADLSKIARGQLNDEDQANVVAKHQLLFLDTDLYVIKVWSEHSYQDCPLWILQEIAQRKYDLYLLTYIDVPWVNDPQREHPQPEMRQYFYHLYRDLVVHSGVPWADIRGDQSTRLQTATLAINRHLGGFPRHSTGRH
jgi:NadR type nicotinamide-nucleotide adenylyltransferase